MSDAKRIKLDSRERPVIVTHSGTFHADEALAVHLLTKLPALADAELVRTRDPAEIAKGTVVVDVGAEYLPSAHRYDHHQRGFFETFDAEHKTKLSSAGLVWKHFGRDILAAHMQCADDDERIPTLYRKMYDDFVEAIDGHDNGIPLYPGISEPPAYRSRTDLSSRISFMNPRWNETWDDADLLARFRRASKLAGTEFFERVDDAVESWLPARQLVVDALRARTYPDEANKWRVQAVPVNPESFESRRALPEAWRGIRDEQLSELSGIPQCVFVHPSGFIGGNHTREGALRMATQALA